MSMYVVLDVHVGRHALALELSDVGVELRQITPTEDELPCRLVHVVRAMSESARAIQAGCVDVPVARHTLVLVDSSRSRKRASMVKSSVRSSGCGGAQEKTFTVSASIPASLADSMSRSRTSWGRCATCLLYTSDAADDLLCVDLGGRRIIKKK